MLSWRVEKQQFPKRPPGGGDETKRRSQELDEAAEGGGYQSRCRRRAASGMRWESQPTHCCWAVANALLISAREEIPPILSPVQSTQACRLAWTPGSGLVFQAEVRIRAGFIFHGVLDPICQQRLEVQLFKTYEVLLLGRNVVSIYFYGRQPQAANQISCILLYRQ